MNYFWLIIKGMFLGITNIIPGVSGGTMAVSLGIYDDMIHAITHLRKEWKSSLKVLLPIGISAVLGIALFAFVIEWLLDAYTLYTAFAFVGLILGGLPILVQSFKESLVVEKKSFNFLHVVLFVVFFLIVAWMGVAEVSGGGPQTVELSAGPLIALFFVGVVAAAAMVVPGISGSLLMLIFGYYYIVINAINTLNAALTGMDFAVIITNVLFLGTFGVGMLVGIALISKLIDYLFKNHPGYTYASILGLVFASPIAVISNTQALAELNGGNTILKAVIALIVCSACFAFAYLLGRTEDAADELIEDSHSTI